MNRTPQLVLVWNPPAVHETICPRFIPVAWYRSVRQIQRSRSGFLSGKLLKKAENLPIGEVLVNTPRAQATARQGGLQVLVITVAITSTCNTADCPNWQRQTTRRLVQRIPRRAKISAAVQAEGARTQAAVQAWKSVHARSGYVHHRRRRPGRRSWVCPWQR